MRGKFTLQLCDHSGFSRVETDRVEIEMTLNEDKKEVGR